MPPYVVRLTVGKSELPVLFVQNEFVTRAIAVSHQSEETELHYHVLFSSDRKEDTIRNWFKSKIENYVKTKMSLKNVTDTPEDWDTQAQYLFHTKHDNIARLVCQKNITEDYITLIKERAKAVTDDFEERRQERVKDGKKEMAISKKIMLQIIEECRPAPDTSPQAEDIIREFVQRYNQNRLRMPSKGMMETLVLTVLARWGQVAAVVTHYQASMGGAFAYRNNF